MMTTPKTVMQWLFWAFVCFHHHAGHISMALTTASPLSHLRQINAPIATSTPSIWSLYYINPKLSSETDVVVTPSAQSIAIPVAWMQSTSITDQNDYREALQEVLQEWQPPLNNQQAMAFLFLSPAWADDLQSISTKAQAMLGDQTQLVTVVGGGIVGGGQEVEDLSRHCISFFGGPLPSDSAVDIESFVNDDSRDDATPVSSSAHDSHNADEHVNSHLVFADPYSTMVEKVLEDCSKDTPSIVAGAVTVAAHKQQSTLAIGDSILPPGALLRVNFSGNLGVQVVVSQGCRPVGPTYRVTKVNGPAILELDSMRAIDQLQWTLEKHCNSQDKDFIQTKGMTRGVLGGFYKEEDAQNEYETDDSFQFESETEPPEDFIIRQMTGFQPKSGGIILCGRPTVEEGDFFRFHVRSPSSALEDWQKILKRAQTERLFLGNDAGEFLGALQFSCAARGEALFEEPNVDLHHVQELIRTSINEVIPSEGDRKDQSTGSSPPVAGFFANAEISSLGNSIRMGANPDSMGMQQKSFMHGYATVVAMLCDYSKTNKHDVQSDTSRSSSETTEIKALGIMDLNSTDVWA